jgi:hypothetical protein
MHTFAQPRRGYCASCDGAITGEPIYRRDEAYCCLGCADGGPCTCSYEQNMASDGVDNLGLPFPISMSRPESNATDPYPRLAASFEEDLLDDAVDHLGLPFLPPVSVPEPVRQLVTAPKGLDRSPVAQR